MTGHKPQEAEQEPKLPLPPTPSRKGRGSFGSSSPSSSHPFPLAFSPSLLRLLSPRTHRLLGSIAIYAGYIVVSMIFLFPLLWVASLSLRPMAELFAFPPHLIPQHPTLAAYRDVLIGSPLALYLLNSVKLVSATVLCALAIAIPSAYALSRLRFRQPALKSLVMLGMLAVQLISPLVTALPLYRWFSALGLINSHAALILVYVALSAPFATWMLTGFLDAVPVALDEAARIDGCTRLQSLLRVLLPVMLPGLASTAILLAISTLGAVHRAVRAADTGRSLSGQRRHLGLPVQQRLGEHASTRRRRHPVGAAGDADIHCAAALHRRRADRGRGERIAAA